MLADRMRISRCIPHAGDMCLLDALLECDVQRIRCCSSSHRDKRNPMRSGNALYALCGIEYAAQAMALHGAWQGCTESRPRAGYLAAVRDVVCHVKRLDDLAEDLIIDADKVMGDANRVIYQFTLRAGLVELMSGRATVVLDADKAEI